MEETNSNGICEELIFSNFFKANVKSLRNYLYFKFGNEEKANDATQDSFIKLWENCKKVPLEKAKSYLYTIANNTSLNEISHQKVVLKYAQSNAGNDKTNLNPEFLIEDIAVVLHPLDMVSVAIDQLGAHVTSAAASGQAIADALDELLTRS